MEKLKEDRKPSRFADFEILTKLGTGSFGIVYKVKHKCITHFPNHPFE